MASYDTKDIGCFAAVARSGGFRAAASVTDVSAGALSKAVARLERHIGMPLFMRTSRTSGLTDAGEKLFVGMQPSLAALEQCMVSLKSAEQAQAQTVRIALTAGIFFAVLAPILPEFQLRYPQARLLITLSAAPWQIATEHFDLWLAPGPAGRDGTSSVVKPLRKLLFGSPVYLERYGWPAGPDDITRHECITGALRSGRQARWRFTPEDDGDVIDIQPFGNLQLAHMTEGLLALANLGLGLVLATPQEAAPYLAAALLVNALPGYSVIEDEEVLHFVNRCGVPVSSLAAALLGPICPHADSA